MKKRDIILPALTIAALGFWASAAPSQNRDVAVTVDKGMVEFTVRGQPAGTYWTEGYSKPILWPVLAPGGATMTRAWPMDKDRPGESHDHPHHQSVWFCHGDVIPKGLQLTHKIRGIEGVDFWSVAKGHGLIVCTSVKPRKSGDNWAGIDTVNEWRTADGQKILDEKRTVTLHDFGKARLWVFDIDLAAANHPIAFGDTKEGSMALRVADKISETRGNGMLQNAEGKKREKECWGQLSDWCDYSGTIDGKRVGIAIFDDPKNSSRAGWHSRGYGLMGANPFGRTKAAFPAVKGRQDLVELIPGQHLHLRYGVLVHEGGTEDGNVAAYYQRFLKLRGN
jgi:hypothetical protein